jgi:hypothetical protein
MTRYLAMVQADMAARANADGFFVYTPVIALRELSVATEIESALACTTAKNGKSGTSLMVLMAQLSVETPNAPGPVTRGRITVRALENPKLNNSGITAEEIALKCLDLFHVWLPGYLGGCLVAEKNAVQPSLAFAPRLAYDITFSFPLALAQTQRPVAPRLSYATGLMTMTCATAGAEIRYTTDGDLPVPDSALYAAPVAVDAGTRVRACAYKTDMAGSSVEELTAS